jgi:hypothetical protein
MADDQPTVEFESSWEKRMTSGHETRIGVQNDGSENLRVVRRDGYFEIRDRSYVDIAVEDGDVAKLAYALGVGCGEGCTGNGCSICEVLP